MTKNIANTSWGPFTAVGTGGTYNSWEPNGSGAGTILFEDDFSSGDLSKWTTGSVPVYTANDQGEAHSVSCYYDGVAGTSNRWMNPATSISAENLDDIYIEVRQKFTSYANCKWIKVFGQQNSGEWANTTFSPEASTRLALLHGTGATATNDTQRIAFTDGAWSGTPNPEAVVEESGASGFLFNNTWQDIRLRVKFSDNAQGLMEVWVDGVLRYKVINLTNKNAANLPIDYVGLYDYSNGGGNIGTISFTNFKILKGGWSS